MKSGVERDLGCEGGEQSSLIWVLVDYKLEFNYLGIPAYIRKGNGDVRQSG